MADIVNSLPFGLYVAVLVAAIVFSPYAMYETNKLKPGHPMIWMIPFADIVAVAMILDRCSEELTENLKFQKATDIFFYVSGALFFISLVVTFIIAHKKGYTNAERFKKSKPVLIFCGIGLLICAIILFVLK